MDKLKIEKPQDLIDALETTRSAVAELQRSNNGTATEEQFARVATDIAAIKESAEEARKDAAAAREMAKLGAVTMPKSKLEGREAELRNFPRDKRNVADDELAASYNSPDRRALYDFLTIPDERLNDVFDEDVVKVVQKARRINDALVIMDAGISAALGRNPSALRQYQDNGGMKNFRMYQNWLDLTTPFARAMSTGGAGTGTEWVPTGYATTLVEDIRQPFSVTGMFETVNMPQNPYLLPVQGLPIKSRLLTEGTAITQKNIASLNMTFNAVKQGALALTSTELEEDSIVPIVGIIRSELAWAMSYGLADSIINGQKTAQPDSAVGLGGDTGDVRWSYDGLRYYANALAAYTRLNAAGSLSADILAQLKGLLGRFGNTPDRSFWLMGFITYAKLLTLRDASGWAVVLTADKAGGTSTFDTGLLGKMFGSPLSVEQDYPENMDANGLVTNLGNTGTGLHYINKRGFRLGIRRGVMIEASRERYFDTDQIAFRATGRFHFKATQTPSSVYKYVGSLVGL